MAVVLGLHALLLVMMIILTGRPSSVAVVSPEVKNRDIVLCLDVSRSMYEYDVEIIKTYRTLARKFDGEGHVFRAHDPGWAEGPKVNEIMAPCQEIM